MRKQRRRTDRHVAGQSSVVRIESKDRMGNPLWLTADMVDRSAAGLGILLKRSLPEGATVSARGNFGAGPNELRRAMVRWCAELGDAGYRAGLEFVQVESSRDDDHANGSGAAASTEQNGTARQQAESRQRAKEEPWEQQKQHTQASDPQDLDCYEILQLSPNADIETINRVYKILAQRYHPDNRETGNREQFLELCTAYRILSDPEKRAGYDARYRSAKKLQWKVFEQGTPTGGWEAEQRKREGILSLLYAVCLADPERQITTIHTLEERLGCPREHLNSALWYLKSKGYIERQDSGRYNITINGFDAAEEQLKSAAQDPVKRLTGGLGKN